MHIRDDFIPNTCSYDLFLDYQYSTTTCLTRTRINHTHILTSML